MHMVHFDRMSSAQAQVKVDIKPNVSLVMRSSIVWNWTVSKMTQATLGPITLTWSCPIDILLQQCVESISTVTHAISFVKQHTTLIKQLR